MSADTEKLAAQSQMTSTFKQNETLFRHLIENSTDAIILNDAEGKITYASPSIERILGYTPEEFSALHASTFIHPDDQQSTANLFATLLRDELDIVNTHYRVLHKNGSWRRVEGTWKNRLADPNLQAVVINIHDITEQKQIEERQSILDAVSEMFVSSLDHQITLKEITTLIVPKLADYCRIAVIDDQQQIKEITENHFDPTNIALVSQLYEQYRDRISTTHGLQKLLTTGKPELISVVSQDVLDLVSDNPALVGIVHTLGLQSYMGVPLIARGRTLGAITFSSIQPHRHFTHDDLQFALELARRIAFVFDNARLYRKAQDEIAERKQAEERLRQSEERKDEFISMASHELKTPVTSIKGFTHLLQRRLAKQGDEQSVFYLSRMDTQLDKLTRLINELLDISKMQAGQLDYRNELFDLNALAQEIVEDMQATTPQHPIMFEQQTQVSVVGDRDRIGQVLVNLLLNAIKFSREADSIIVRVFADQDNVCVSVQDFGIGIDEAEQEKIFERFYQSSDPVEKTYPGLGIGLYISNEIVKRHNGRMWVESKKGAGATFFVSIPRPNSPANLQQ